MISDRKPQAATTMNGIQDWHLMVMVSILILVDVIALTFYTLLEGLVDNFGVLRVPSKENLSSVSGVRQTNYSIGIDINNISLFTGVGNNHITLHLSVLNKIMDKNFISGSSCHCQVCTSNIWSLSCL